MDAKNATGSSLPRKERLKSAKEIDRLFESEARRVKAYPLQFIFRESEQARGDSPLQLTFSVPKRRYRKAVQRNYYKRRLREAYRINKELLLHDWPADQPQIALMILLAGPPPETFQAMCKAMQKGLARLRREIN